MKNFSTNFKGQIFKDSNGNSYIINGFANNSLDSIEMIVFTSLSNKEDVFILPKSEFLNAINPNSTQKQKFYISNENIPLPSNTLFIEDKPILEKTRFKNFPKPHKGVVFLIILLCLIILIGVIFVSYIQTFH